MKKIIHTFIIPIFAKVGNEFLVQSEKEFIITYGKGTSVKKFEVIVNGKKSGVYINIMSAENPFKPLLLTAISKFENGLLENSPTTNKGLDFDSIKAVYPKNVIKVIKNHLLSINSEKRRDTLTKYNLLKY